PPRLIRAAHPTASDPGAPCVPRVAASPPASFPPRLTTTQLPLACGWCHQPPQGTRTPELLVMPGAPVGTAVAGGPPHGSQRAGLPHWAPPSGSGVEALVGPGVQDAGPG